MKAGRRVWREALFRGLIWSAAAVFISVAGMVEAFGGRELLAGVVSMGHALLLIIALGAGYQTAERQSGEGPLAPLLRGTLGGAVTGTALAALVTAGSLVDLRAVLVNASPVLMSLISFGRGVAGVYLTILMGAAAGAVGAAGTLLSREARLPIVSGLVAVLAFGLFQELLQLLLAEGAIRSVIREFLFDARGLLPRGALAMFALAAAISASGPRRTRWVRSMTADLPPARRRNLALVGTALGLLALLVLPQVAGPFISQVLVLVGLYTLMGLGLNLEVGYAGLLDLGFVAFFAIGAYTVGLLTSVAEYGIFHLSFWAAVPVAVLVSLIAGVVLGVPVLRIRGDYLAIATLGFGEIVRLLVLSDFLRPWLGGSQGVLSIPSPRIGLFEFTGPEQIFYLTLVSSVFVAYVAARLRDSRLGRAWMALREDEDVAEAMGINLVNVKLLAYGLGAAFAGVSGAIFAVMVGSVFPHSFQLLISINVLALIIVGGIGSMPGVMVGALFLVGLPELLREFADFRFMLYGASLVVMMQLRPEGLWPAAALRRELHVAEEPAVPQEAVGVAGAGQAVEG